jgi:hypothetical protein
MSIASGGGESLLRRAGRFPGERRTDHATRVEKQRSDAMTKMGENSSASAWTDGIHDLGSKHLSYPKRCQEGHE